MPLSLWEQTTIGLVRGLKGALSPPRAARLPSFRRIAPAVARTAGEQAQSDGSDRRLAGPTSRSRNCRDPRSVQADETVPEHHARRAPGSRRHAWERVARRTLYAKVAVLAVLLLAGAAVYVRLSSGPISMKWLGGRMAAALAEQIGPDWAVTVQRSALVLKDGALGLRATELEIRNPEGALVLRAPYAVLTVDTLPLLTASINPRSIELQDLQLRASVNPDGSLSFLPATEAGPERTGALADAAAAGEPASQSAAGTASVRPSSLSAALSSLFELIVDPAHIVGAIDTARVTNARLTLVDEDQRERVAFNRVDATFAHSQSRTRQFDMRLHGAYGPWRIGGQVFRGRGARRDGTIVITDIPIHDLLLLTGLSGMPAETDLKISARAEASLTKGGSRASRSAPRGRQRLRADRGQGHVPVPRRQARRLGLVGRDATAAGAGRHPVQGRRYRAQARRRAGPRRPTSPGGGWRSPERTRSSAAPWRPIRPSRSKPSRPASAATGAASLSTGCRCRATDLRRHDRLLCGRRQ